MEYTTPNCKILAQKIVQSWDMSTVIQFAVDTLEESYRKSKDCFLDDCEEIEEL